MVVAKGDLVWVKLPPPRGSEPAGRRPALVIQSDAFNLSRISTIIIAAITSNLKFESMPGNIRLSKGEFGIPKPSVINLSQMHSIDRDYITEKIGTLSKEKLSDVDRGLKIIFDLS